MTTKPIKKILYIDDEPHALVSFKSCFREHFTVFTASSAEEGLKILARHNEEKDPKNRIQIVISDQRMPNMTGVEVFTQMVQAYPDPIRILLTGYSDMADLVNAVNSGKIFAYHPKPWDEEKLLKMLNAASQLYLLQTQEKQLLDELKVVNDQLEFMIRQKLLS